MTNDTYGVDKLKVVNGTYYNTDDVKSMLSFTIETLIRGIAKRGTGKIFTFYDYNKELHVRYNSLDARGEVYEEHQIDENGRRMWNARLIVSLSRRNKLHASPLALLGDVGSGQQTVPEPIIRSMCTDFALKVIANRGILTDGRSRSGYDYRGDLNSLLIDSMPVAPIIRIESKVETSSRKAARKSMLVERVNRSVSRKQYYVNRVTRLEAEVATLKEEIEKLTVRIDDDNAELSDVLS